MNWEHPTVFGFIVIIGLTWLIVSYLFTVSGVYSTPAIVLAVLGAALLGFAYKIKRGDKS